MNINQKKRHMELVIQLVEIATELEWHIAIPAADLNQMVEGVVLGTQGFVETVAGSLQTTELQYLEIEEKVMDEAKKRKSGSNDPTFH